MQSFEPLNNSDIESESGEADNNHLLDTDNTMNTKRNRAVNLLVRTVATPIKKNHMVIKNNVNVKIKYHIKMVNTCSNAS